MNTPRWIVTLSKVRGGWFWYTKDPFGKTVLSGTHLGHKHAALSLALRLVPVGHEYELRVRVAGWETPRIQRKEKDQ